MEAKFGSNDIVQRVNQPEINGVVLNAYWDDQTESWTYQVQFNSAVTVVPESSLRSWKRLRTGWEKLRNLEFSGINHFRDTITFHKVKSPTARVAHAYSSARTMFYPHQFKPLLKFLDGGGSGLLIADDVGLGKTIEAGYILRELDARKNLERVIVLAPARLATKWKREMAQRFDEPFDIVRGTDLISLSKSLERGKEVSPFKWIVSYEGARNRDVQEAIDISRPGLDLLIVDEAHRLRNAETSQHRIGRLLCDLADYRIFLTATPVQNSLDDLWNLLRLLSEDEFPDMEIFRRQLDANHKVLQCQRYLSSNPPRIDDAISSLSAIRSSDGFGAPISESFLASIVSRIKTWEGGSEEMAELNLDITQLNTLGKVVSRTRKSEAMPGCAQRSARWRPIDFTTPERRIYESVAQLCRVRPSSGSSLSWGFQMATLMAYRITASCIPAAIQYFEEKLEYDDNNSRGYFDDFEVDNSEYDSGISTFATDASSWFQSQKDILSELVNDWADNNKIDTKFEVFREALDTIWEEDREQKRPKRKIVVFSFFRKTLEYLRHSLEKNNYRVRMIHGKIALQDRDQAIGDFLERSDVEILLTSEVGGEGIDLQNASVVFNYDLPWNPMVVEQRIGRVDRIGQKAERIVIINFVVKESIEEKILERLLNKIGIFEMSVGEIDPIIGDQIEKITREAVSGFLTDEELEKKLLIEEQAIANRTIAAKQIGVKAEELLTSDQALLDEIAALTEEKQVPGEIDLLQFLNNFLAVNYPGFLIPERSLSDVQRFKLSSQLAREMEESSAELGSDLAFFGRKIGSGEIIATLSREIAYRNINADLIHFNHPLVKFAVWKQTGLYGNETFCLSLDNSKILNDGLYAFAVRILEIDGIISKNKFNIAVTDVQNNNNWTDQADTISIILEIFENGRSGRPPEINSQVYDQVENRLVSLLDQIKVGFDSREKRLSLERLNQRKSISIRLAEMKLIRARDQMARMIGSGAKEFALRMGELKVKKAEETLSAISRTDDQEGSAGVTGWTDIAVGYLQVGKTP